MLIFIWYVTSTRSALQPAAGILAARAGAAFAGNDSMFLPLSPPAPYTASHPPVHPLRRPSLFRTTSAAVMPAANAREKLTQASPYGRARCIDRLLRCTTSSTLARVPHPTFTPRSPAVPPPSPTAASPAKPSRNPLCLHLVPARPGFSPVGCASIPDLTLLRRRFARRDATRRDAMRRAATQRLRDLRRSAADWNARTRRFTLPWIISLARAPRISSKIDRRASNA